MTAVLFYSKSKDKSLAYLSNFTLLSTPIAFRGLRFQSAEHAFQASKYIVSGRKDIAARFAVGGDITTPQDAKRAGGKAGFQRLEVKLDVDRWQEERVAMMTGIIVARFRCDPQFRRTLLDLHRRNVRLYHFSWRGGRFWGGLFPKGAEKVDAAFKGRNMLGKIMMNVTKAIAEK